MMDVDRTAMALMDKMSTDGHEVNYTQCREYAALAVAATMCALGDVGMLATPERDAAVAAEWADHFEACQGAVGPERLTVESMIAALRGPRPFGCEAGESNADA